MHAGAVVLVGVVLAIDAHIGAQAQRSIARQGDVLDGIAAKMLTKYRGVATPVSPEAIAAERTRIEDGIVWVFELVPR